MMQVSKFVGPSGSGVSLHRTNVAIRTAGSTISLARRDRLCSCGATVQSTVEAEGSSGHRAKHEDPNTVEVPLASTSHTVTSEGKQQQRRQSKQSAGQGSQVAPAHAGDQEHASSSTGGSGSGRQKAQPGSKKAGAAGAAAASGRQVSGSTLTAKRGLNASSKDGKAQGAKQQAVQGDGKQYPGAVPWREMPLLTFSSDDEEAAATEQAAGKQAAAAASKSRKSSDPSKQQSGRTTRTNKAAAAAAAAAAVAAAGAVAVAAPAKAAPAAPPLPPPIRPVLTGGLAVALGGKDASAADAAFIQELARRAQQLSASGNASGGAALGQVVEELQHYHASALKSGPADSYTAGLRARLFGIDQLSANNDDSLGTGEEAALEEMSSDDEGEEEGGEGKAGKEGEDGEEHWAHGDDTPDPKYMAEVEVASEIMDAVLGVRLPRKAYVGLRARSLAAMGEEAVKAQCRAWADVCGLEYARLFLTREPRLLTQEPATLLKGLEAVSSEMGFDPAGCVAFALRNASLVINGHLTQPRLAAVIAELREVLGVDQREAAKIAYRRTVLLTMQPGDIRARFDALAALLPVTRERLAHAARKRAQLLSGSLSAVARVMVALSAVLRTPLKDSAVMLAAEPGMAGLAPTRIAARWRRLAALCAQHSRWGAALAGYTPASLARCLKANDACVRRLEWALRHKVQDHENCRDVKMLLVLSESRFKSHVVRLAPSRQRSQRAVRKAEGGEEGAAGEGEGKAGKPAFDTSAWSDSGKATTTPQ